MMIIVLLLIKIDTKWLGTRKTFEWFSTAGRNIKTGLIASSVVSAWTWTATFLESSSVSFQFGISGSFWYAAGASIQILLFVIIIGELKKKSPSSHTFTEFLYYRFGKSSHKVFLFFALLTNTIVTAMLVLGGAVVVNALTGVDILFATILIPLGVIIYTLVGGLKATFFADYINTSIIFIVLLIFVLTIYFIDPNVNGISGIYEKLVSISKDNPVIGNAGGSYLTLASIGALIFGIINIVGNFGTVFVDQAFWQRAVASRPHSAMRGFLFGGLVWFAIPFTLSTSIGLYAISMEIPLSHEQIEHGLVAPMTSIFLLGDIGGILLLTILFTAITCAGSAEIVAVSSLVTFDLYRTYIKPSSSGRELTKISRISILVFGFGIGIVAYFSYFSGLTLEYIYLSMGILIGSAVGPIALSLIWKKTNGRAASIAAIGGLFFGVSIWIILAYNMYDEISLYSTGQLFPLLFGNLASLSSGIIITIIGSLIKPDRFDFRVTRQRILIRDEKTRNLIKQDTDINYLKKLTRLGYRYSIFISFLLVILWPLPLFFSGYVFSLDFFYFWVFLSIIWALFSSILIILKPILESRSGISVVLTKLSMLIRNKKEIHNESTFDNPEMINQRILVPVDGSTYSLKALDYVKNTYDSKQNMIFILYIIEWSDSENDEQYDSFLLEKMENEGRRLLTTLISSKISRCERIVKIGDPSSKIIELSNRLNIDMIVLGVKGLGNTELDLGHVTRNIILNGEKPVLLIK